jgi:hypothetical protein
VQRVPLRAGVSALRRSVPAINPEAGDVQGKLEEAAYLLRIPNRKPWGAMVRGGLGGLGGGGPPAQCGWGARGARGGCVAPRPRPPAPIHWNLQTVNTVLKPHIERR